MEPSEEMLDLFCSKLGLEVEKLKQDEDLLHYLQLNSLNLHRAIRKGSKETAIVLYEDVLLRNRLNTIPVMQVFKDLFGLRISLMKKQREESIEQYEKTVELQEYAPEWMKPYYYRYAGLFHYMFGSLTQSLHLYKQAEKLVPVGEIEDIYYQLALVQHLLGEYSMSTYYEEKALELFVRKMDYEQCVNCQLLLGINYRHLGNLERAKETYLSILEKVVPLNNRELIAKVYHNLGMVYSDKGKTTEAITAFETSLSYRDENNTKMKTYYALAKEFLRSGDEGISAKWVELGEKIAESLNDEEYIIKFQVLNFKLEKQEKDSVFEYYLSTVALPYFEKRSEDQMIKEYIIELVAYYEEARQYKSALMYLKKLV